MDTSLICKIIFYVYLSLIILYVSGVFTKKSKKKDINMDNDEIKKLKDIIYDLLEDKHEWVDIHKATGLPSHRCKEIRNIFLEISKEKEKG